MADLYSTAVLLGVIRHISRVQTFLLDNFFPLTQTEESEDIHFDVVKRGRTIAPFVSPLVEGQIVQGAGYSTKTFRPAFMKPKGVVNPRQALKRRPGEALSGQLTAQQRLELIVRELLADHLERIVRRLEVMAAEALQKGQVTVKGEKYPTTVVDFGRDAALSFAALTTTKKWTHADSTPLMDIETWCQAVLKLEGVVITDIIHTLDAWNAFSNHADVKAKLDNRRIVAGNLDTQQPADIGAVFRGNIDGRNHWTYQDWYIDPDDETETEKPMIEDGYVVGTSRALNGVKAFGAVPVTEGDSIRIYAEPYVPTSWVNKDPPMRYVMTQSAPLIVPTKPNATFSCKVV
jgi:hypothetical protein